MTEKANQIIEVEIPVAEAADMMTKAAAAGMTLSYYVGSLALLGSYGIFHPRSKELLQRAKPGICGPETQGGGK